MQKKTNLALPAHCKSTVQRVCSAGTVVNHFLNRDPTAGSWIVSIDASWVLRGVCSLCMHNVQRGLFSMTLSPPQVIQSSPVRHPEDIVFDAQL